ncbi:hypothetical protein DFQ27_000952, partial [Actinomortierella ambigua]
EFQYPIATRATVAMCEKILSSDEFRIMGQQLYAQLARLSRLCILYVNLFPRAWMWRQAPDEEDFIGFSWGLGRGNRWRDSQPWTVCSNLNGVRDWVMKHWPELEYSEF